MSLDDPALLVAFLGATVSLLSAYFTYRSASQANRSNERRVEIEAANATGEIWSDAVAQLRLQLAETRTKLADEQVERKFLQSRVHELELTVGRLQSKLRTFGVTEFDDRT